MLFTIHGDPEIAIRLVDVAIHRNQSRDLTSDDRIEEVNAYAIEMWGFYGRGDRPDLMKKIESKYDMGQDDNLQMFNVATTMNKNRTFEYILQSGIDGPSIRDTINFVVSSWINELSGTLNMETLFGRNDYTQLVHALLRNDMIDELHMRRILLCATDKKDAWIVKHILKKHPNCYWIIIGCTDPSVGPEIYGTAGKILATVDGALYSDI